MDINISKDILAIREILNLSQQELADLLGVQQITVSRNEIGMTEPSAAFLEKFYTFAFDQNISINRLKEMFCQEEIKRGHLLLYHGAKDYINGNISVSSGRTNNDFGPGFYTGETYSQAVSFVSGFEDSSLYLIDFDSKGLKCKKYSVDREWMLTIAYYRGTLGRYRDDPLVTKVIKESRKCDYIIAPIADNRMFQIIDSFIAGEITDEQCKHCLAATHLGNQYVLVSERSAENLKVLEHCYLSQDEKKYYQNIRSSEAKLGNDKVKLARIEYRGQGQYIDEILLEGNKG